MTLHRRRLPHLHTLGQPVFITFRLHGSLPSNRRFPASNLTSGQAFVVMDQLLDQAQCGPVFLRREPIAKIVRASIQRGVEIGHYEIHSWVIMPNHVHLLLTRLVGVSRLMASLKSATARRANLLLQRSGQPFWQDESYDHLVRNREEFGRIQRYIENNPVTACLVASPEQYTWSSVSGADPRSAVPISSVPPGEARRKIKE